ncbi:MAG: hypothetical protein WD278_16925, partial [Pirellulales bacterium]
MPCTGNRSFGRLRGEWLEPRWLLALDTVYICETLQEAFTEFETHSDTLAGLVDPNASPNSPLANGLPLISDGDWNTAVDLVSTLASVDFPTLACGGLSTAEVKQELESHGFTVSFIISDEELATVTAGDGTNLITVSKPYQFNNLLDPSGLEIAQDLGISSIPAGAISGALNGDAALALDLTVGATSSGAYFGPETNVTLGVDVAGNLAADIPQLNVAAQGALDFISAVSFSEADADADGKVTPAELSAGIDGLPLDLLGTAALDVEGALTQFDVQVQGDFQWALDNAGAQLNRTDFSLGNATFFSGQVAVSNVSGTYDGSLATIESGTVQLDLAVFGPNASASLSEPIVLDADSVQSGAAAFSNFELPQVGGFQATIDSALLSFSAQSDFELTDVAGHVLAHGVVIDFGGIVQSNGDFALAADVAPFDLGSVTVQLSGNISRTAGEIDFALTADLAGELIAGLVIEELSPGEPSHVHLTSAGGLVLDARAEAFGVKLLLAGDIHPTGDFSVAATADSFELGDLDVDLVGTLTRVAGVIDYSLAAEIAGTLVAGLVIEELSPGQPSLVTLTKVDGLELDARAEAFGVKLLLAGAIHPTGDFSVDATADSFELGDLDVDLVGTLTRVAGMIDYSLAAEIAGTLVAGLVIE